MEKTVKKAVIVNMAIIITLAVMTILFWITNNQMRNEIRELTEEARYVKLKGMPEGIDIRVNNDIEPAVVLILADTKRKPNVIARYGGQILWATEWIPIQGIENSMKEAEKLIDKP